MPGNSQGANTLCEQFFIVPYSSPGIRSDEPYSDDDLGPEQLLHYSIEGIVDGDDSELDNERPIFCSSTEEILILTDDVLSVSVREVHKEWVT